MYCYRCAGITLVLIALLTTGSHAAFADEVVLTNGDHISGRLVRLSSNAVYIETAASGIIRIERKYIEHISLDNADAEESIQSQSSVPLSDVVGRGTESSTASQEQPAKSPETQNPKPIGQKPEDESDIRKIFLRQSTVLLRPGQLEVEAGIGYLHNQSVSPILNAKFRQLRVPLSARIGLFNRAEGYVTVPISYAQRDLSFADSGISNHESGIGDAAAGLNYEIMRETANRPDIIAFAGLEAPTGSKPNEEGLSLGSGHWGASFGVQFIKTVDPIALFWGINYGHQFEARYFLNDAIHTVNPGETVGYNFGFGFAANENVSLSAQIIGSYQSGTKADAAKIFGSSSEPVSLRSALTYRHSRRTYLEPSVTIGLDDETSDFVLGISLTHRFGK